MQGLHPGRKNKGRRGLNSWHGIVSFICGVVGFFIPFFGWLILGIAALVFEIIGASKLRHRKTGFAIAGIILGAIEIIATILVVILFTPFLGVI